MEVRMSDIKELLHEAVGSYKPRADQRAVEERVERHRQRRRLIAASTALAVFAAAGTLTWAAFAPGSNQGAGTGSASLITHTVQGVTVTHRASWTLIDLWPLAPSIATWPEPVGSSITVPDDTPERGGLPVLQLSNEDLGLRSLCGTDLTGQESFLYVALNGGPLRVNPDGSPVWMSELSEGDGPCGRGWYAYKKGPVMGPYGDVTGSTPYLVFAGFGSTVSQGDRDAVFAAFDSLDFAPFDFLHPPNEGSPSYVRSDATLPPVADAAIVPDVIGLSRDQAVAQLEDLGLAVAVALGASQDTPERLVASQDPAPGTSVDAGTTVTIVISEGAAREWPEVSYGGDFTPYVDHVIDLEGVLDPDVVGKKHVVAYGTVQGIPWSLTGFMSTDHSNDPIPVGELFLGRGGLFGGSGLRFSGPQFGVSGTGFGSVGLTAYAGIVGESVAAVEFRPASGDARPIRLFEGPSTVGARYFVLWPPTGAVGEIVALDASGEVVDQASLCVSADIPEDSTVGC
jgi:hypothetical protein